MSHHNLIDRITTQTLLKMKSESTPISVLTAYDFSFARILDAAGIDVLLVGDSASNVVAGYETTLPITLDNMIFLASSVVRATKRALVVADLPFGSYQISPEDALRSAIRMIKNSGVQAVKLEGGREMAKTIEKVTSAGIPVMGHLGLTPQSIHKFGSYSVRASSDDEAAKLLEDAAILEQSGCFAVVLEKIPAKLGADASRVLNIPTIGIGAGSGVDGQVLVVQDMLGINEDFHPKFLRRYAHLYQTIKDAAVRYNEDVKLRGFPDKSEQY